MEIPFNSLMIEKSFLELGVVAHTSNPYSRSRGRRISEFKTCLVYRVSSRTTRTTQRKTASKKIKKKREEKNHLSHKPSPGLGSDFQHSVALGPPSPFCLVPSLLLGSAFLHVSFSPAQTCSRRRSWTVSTARKLAPDASRRRTAMVSCGSGKGRGAV